MNNFHVIIDSSMIQNIFHTNMHEAQDLLDWHFYLSISFLGILPSLIIYKFEIEYPKIKKRFWNTTRFFALFILITPLLLLTFNRYYASFFREHKPLRYYTNPTYYLYSAGKFAHQTMGDHIVELKAIGMDAHVKASARRKNLMIFVAGETVRADRFSLNGYERETNPKLKTVNIINFTNFKSSFTSTAQSLPCMFSAYTADDFDANQGRSTENLLDILHRAGVQVLWRENNTGSQGVADRVTYEDFTDPAINPLHDVESRDLDMLKGLQAFIDQHQEENIFIVLHQLGNHGPAYYKRYPKEFEKFTPAQKSSQLNECSIEEISNAYDNATLYTDSFLFAVIELLKANDQNFKTTMFYVSDHGESLGENGYYLHGLPNFMAPDIQRHVPAIIWLGQHHGVAASNFAQSAHSPASHDNIFHTALGCMDIDTKLYLEKYDLLMQPVKQL